MCYSSAGQMTTSTHTVFSSNIPGLHFQFLLRTSINSLIRCFHALSTYIICNKTSLVQLNFALEVSSGIVLFQQAAIDG